MMDNCSDIVIFSESSSASSIHGFTLVMHLIICIICIGKCFHILDPQLLSSESSSASST